MKNDISVTRGSGNVFADLRLPDAEELLLRAQIKSAASHFTPITKGETEMSFLQREHDKLHELCCSLPNGHETYQRAYIAKQTLAWAMDPDRFMSPSGHLAKFDGAQCSRTDGTGVGQISEPEKPAPRIPR